MTFVDSRSPTRSWRSSRPSDCWRRAPLPPTLQPGFRPIPGSGQPPVNLSAAPQEDYCDYIHDNGTGLCFKASPFGGTGDIPNWGKYGCRNVDGSFYNNSPFTIRLYYGPNYGDPHACIKPFTKITDLFNYDFNSGTGSSRHLVVGNDVASSTMSLTACTNPI